MLYLETYYVKSLNICDWISLSRFSDLGTFSGLRTFQTQDPDRIYVLAQQESSFSLDVGIFGKKHIEDGDLSKPFLEKQRI